MNTHEIYWLAGLLEGEGCFSIQNHGTNPSIRIVLQMTDEDTVVRANALLCGTLFKVEKINGRKTSWRIDLSVQKEVASWMMTLYPLMSERRKDKIIECLKIWRSYPYPKYKNCPQGHSWELRIKNTDGNRYCGECARVKARKKREEKSWNKYWGLEEV